MNSPIFMISRKALQVPETSPTAAVSPDAAAATGRHLNEPSDSDTTMTLIVLLSATALSCVLFLCFKLLFCPGGYPEDYESPSERRRRFAAAVNSLPLVPYGRTATHRIMIDECPICLGEFRETERVKLIPFCGHVFHPSCLDTWLDSHVTCPVCRSDQLFKRRAEVCLDVAPDRSEDRAAGPGERSTGDTWRDRGLDGIRRTCSCSDLPNRTALHRSASF